MHIYDEDTHDLYNISSKSYIQINSCGINTPQTSYYVIRKNGRCDYHILYVAEGELTACTNKNKCILKKGGFVLYPPKTPQKYRYEPGSKVFWIHFNGFQAEEIIADTGLDIFSFSPPYSARIENLFSDLLTEHSIAKQNLNSLEKGVLITLLYTLGSVSRKKENALTDERIMNCMSYINSHYNTDITNDMLARMCCLSKSRFLHLFKSTVNLTPHAYMQQLRIENAKKLLESTKLTISEISEANGYTDPLYFSRIFKKCTGLSPNVYRQRFK